MDNVIPLPVPKHTGKEEADYVLRIWNALSNLPRVEKERLVRIFELMALSMEIELTERSGDPQAGR
ncbi:hypothetical protein [Pedomonas sp. V897]|uniref:hypothetical protein n=1 Tax=Pedomonas sp. V897 TaxID=3446482 RepID=UPI003EE2244E